ncbi:MAG: hypothetical protein V4507_14165 [Verrucomicrobiota bacterium]
MNSVLLVFRWFLWIFLGIWGLVGCSSQPAPVSIDPAAVVQKNYNYSAPADIDRQSKPVWILPMMSQGWIPAKIDSQTGDWVGGHYQATIIQEGHWATLEEAEQSGRPFVRSGEGQPIVPPLSSPCSSQGGAELDVAHLESRVTQIETAQATAEAEKAKGNSVVISPQKPGTVQTLDVGGQKKLTVRYRENDEVEILYGSKQYIKKLPHPNAMLRITVPDSGSPSL